MIKFFRRIRYNLMEQNKTGKYLKYAVGEIVLVVLGILIALQINNWNNQKIERNLETNILNEILVNLKKDVININSKITFNEDKIKYNSEVLEHLKNKTPLTDSLRIAYARLLGRGTFQPITVAYENLKSKGVDIIQNDSIRIGISELYDFKYYYITHDLKYDYASYKEWHESEVHKNVTTSFNNGHLLAEPNNLSEAQENHYFKEALTKALIFYAYMNRLYMIGINQNEQVQNLIIEELGEREKA